jgi:ABC-type antimicrobial peptide transport system permease subunit
MLLHHLRLALRTFLKNQVAFLINLVGMSIALGCSITAWVNYEYNAEFDQLQTNASNLYRIAFWQAAKDGNTPYGVCPMPVGNLLRTTMHDGDQVIQYISKSGQFRIGEEMFQEEFIYTDPVFTSLFTIDLLSGSLSLEDKGQVLISDKLARTYFGKEDVVGQSITQIVSGNQKEFIIGGVFREFEANSSFRFDLITHYDNYFDNPTAKLEIESNWARWSTTFLYLKNPNSAEAIKKQLTQYVSIQNEARPDLKIHSFYVEPFKGMSARAVRERNQGHWMNMPMPPAAVIAPFAMAGFLLLVACFNFMNNAIAVAGNRLKEIGIRKVIGGRRKELIIQFLAETLVFCVLALLLGMVLAEYFTAGWNGMWSGIEIRIRYADNLELMVVLSVLVLLTALLAGGYPAFYISSFRPIQILRGTTRFGGANLLTKSLLVFQFSISLAAVIFALAFYFNSKFQRSYDLGYAWRSVVQVPLEDPKQFALLKNEIGDNEIIQSIGGSEHHIYSSSYKAAARGENQIEKEIDMLNVGDDYFKTVNVRLLAGTVFQKDKASDINESIIVNEEFVRVFNLGAEPVGKRILLNDSIPVYITGVVKDVFLRALFLPLTPVAFRYVPEGQYKYLVASAEPGDLVALNAQLKQAWQKLFPTQLYPGRLMEYNMVMALEHFDSVVMLYTFLGIVAIIMSVSGLYSLVSLNLQKRTKELGLRKLLGASLGHIVVQSGKLFLMIMLISFLIGSLLGAIMVNAMMDSVWEYYEAVDVTVISLAVIILMGIALVTIGFKIRRVATANPVESLRYE